MIMIIGLRVSCRVGPTPTWTESAELIWFRDPKKDERKMAPYKYRSQFIYVHAEHRLIIHLSSALLIDCLILTQIYACKFC